MRWWAAAVVVLCLSAGCAPVEQAEDGPGRSGPGAGAAADDTSPAERTDRERRRDARRERRDRRADHRARSTPTPKPEPATARTSLVTRIIDGDTIELGNGETVRLVGIDTPEVGTCGFEQAAARLGDLVLGRQVRLTGSDEDRDRYDRLLRYVDVGRTDSGLQLIKEGLAIARYDSRDGYGFHPREPRYVAEDEGSKPVCASTPQPLVQQPPKGGCAPGYAPCVPSYPPDVDCADVDGPIRVTGADPHGLDGEGDGIACE